MKIKKICTVETPMDIAINEARLLTKEEVEALPERFKLYDNWWWTSTANVANPVSAWFVSGPYGYLIRNIVDSEGSVRPTLIFESKDLEVGDKFLIGEKEFEVIKESLAFCTSDIGECAFREDFEAEDANDYEKSDIKKYIDKWFEENVK